MKEIKTIKDIPKEDLIVGGSLACQGCGAILGIKLVLKALGKNTIMVNSSGCMTLVPTYPLTSFKIPWIHVAIENGGAVASGISHALEMKGQKNVNVVVYAGDGATADIGFQSLSGALDRGDDFIYVCYDNQSFGNTGVQRSSETPYGAYTTTTPTGKNSHVGNPKQTKPLAKIIAAHGIPYVATAAVGYPLDFIRKLQKASKIKGPKFIHLLSPCQPGWGYETHDTINTGKLAVQTGFWPLYEMENGKFMLNMNPGKLKPVEEYLKTQVRFRHLEKKNVMLIQQKINERWEKLLKGNFWES
ncbi:MAG: 2-ketoisovalerate ferredoxin oxidoreductase [Candidatus Aenigmarchaeota archaeon CG_4_10_14_0_8_um_filter_37_24]|nr:pyruvate synthase subunit beta [Candidatus Aenigmarchaeota archaeon]OIN88181.1 MAG: 2-ketoisovalerate ferredoxin oxidoreductase [Candidatus Aenigmarchaeota archaeon CG1_02_38_14]PIV68656.1 MAG: 2-ketoisovalerate ferredoxin oxidoreductase [Candidatus Aenigmarchaeota archaeon CG01_land_8_20_14_3_00_37_9]PIW41113.1 MAG: 2-ketoisovalerate ferredoxin oxidoreductase [Candidatus Aenigmarchaeota archaeon CG15_BIG_FIL_POST_REV_8_21_14_020_37_27]PIX50902.1 MAG: 2-ketoisovalerate ferredoxin oxidoreduct